MLGNKPFALLPLLADPRVSNKARIKTTSDKSLISQFGNDAK